MLLQLARLSHTCPTLASEGNCVSDCGWQNEMPTVVKMMLLDESCISPAMINSSRICFFCQDWPDVRRAKLFATHSICFLKVEYPSYVQCILIASVWVVTHRSSSQTWFRDKM